MLAAEEDKDEDIAGERLGEPRRDGVIDEDIARLAENDVDAERVNDLEAVMLAVMEEDALKLGDIEYEGERDGDVKVQDTCVEPAPPAAVIAEPGVPAATKSLERIVKATGEPTIQTTAMRPPPPPPPP